MFSWVSSSHNCVRINCKKLSNASGFQKKFLMSKVPRNVFREKFREILKCLSAHRIYIIRNKYI